MTVIGRPRSIHKKFKFLVEIDDVAVAKFTNCSELSSEIAVVSYYEGGALTPLKEPGRASFEDVTLERGAVTSDLDLSLWYKQVVNAAANSGLATPNYKRTLDIVQLDRDNEALRRWTLYNAWPSMFRAGEWDNDSDENVIEAIRLSYDYFELSFNRGT